MTEVLERIRGASRDLDVPVDGPRLSRAVAVRRGRQQRRRVLVGGAVAAVVACLALVVLPRLPVGDSDLVAGQQGEVWTPGHAEAADQTFPATRVVHLAPQTRVTTVDSVPGVGTGDVVLALASGAATFEVDPSRHRRVVVVADDVSVEVVGTVFTVVRSTAPPGVRVTVARGVVRVRQGGRVTHLSVGDARFFSRVATPPGAASSTPSPAPVASGASSTPSTPSPAPVSAGSPASSARSPSRGRGGWRQLAREGEYTAAHRALEAGGGVRSADDLLLAADVARLSGHGAEATRHLRAFLRQYPGDPRNASATFTLARLVGPAEAATLFGRVRQQGGPLAVNAAYREILALRASGQGAAAATRERAFVARYPTSPLTKALRRKGGD